MDFIQGNYTGQSNYSFPMDCETLDYIQTNNYMSQIIGNICNADCVILSGCGANGNGRGTGYVFVKTIDHPEGEVLFYDAANVIDTPTTVYLRKEWISIQSNNVNYQNAYTRRWISPVEPEDTASAPETFEWRQFVLGKNCGSLFGEIKIWSGSDSNIPDGYLLCDGSEYSKNDYPYLFDAIGGSYNTQFKPTDVHNSQNVWTSPQSDSFRVPDLRSRFVVGYDRSDSSGEYTLHKQGGKGTVQLTSYQSGLPTHSHTTSGHTHGVGTYHISGSFTADDSMLGIGRYDDSRFKPAGAFVNKDGPSPTLNIDFDTYNDKEGGRLYLDAGAGSGFTGNSGSATVDVNSSESADAAQAHENRPRYFAMAYIIRAR